jgi:hypothetical protein
LLAGFQESSLDLMPASSLRLIHVDSLHDGKNADCPEKTKQKPTNVNRIGVAEISGL